MNATMQAIRHRYACRAFTDCPIAPELLHEIGEAGLRAPSSHNGQPWRINLVTQRDLLADLDAAALEVVRVSAPASHDRVLARGGRVFYGAPALAIVTYDPLATGRPEFEAGIVFGLMCIAAASLDVETCGCALLGPVLEGSAGPLWKERLGIPAPLAFGGALMLGYPADQPTQSHPPDSAKLVLLG